MGDRVIDRQFMGLLPFAHSPVVASEHSDMLVADRCAGFALLCESPTIFGDHRRLTLAGRQRVDDGEHHPAAMQAGVATARVDGLLGCLGCDRGSARRLCGRSELFGRWHDPSAPPCLMQRNRHASRERVMMVVACGPRPHSGRRSENSGNGRSGDGCAPAGRRVLLRRRRHPMRLCARSDSGVPLAGRSARAVGDDRILERSWRTVDSDLFTGDTAEQRRTWFERGFQTADPEACATFDGSLAP